MFGVDTKEVVAFVLSVPPNTASVVTERLKADGTIESVVVRFYSGQSRELQVRPKLRRTGNREEDLITYPAGTNQWLAGEDDRQQLDVSVPVSLDDELSVYYNNTNPTYPYTLVCYITVDYKEGQNRA